MTSEDELKREARRIVKDGMKRGVDEIISHALQQWTTHGYGFPEEQTRENRERWLKIRREADSIVARVVEFLDADPAASLNTWRSNASH